MNHDDLPRLTDEERAELDSGYVAIEGVPVSAAKDRHEVSGVRHVILRFGSNGRLVRRFGYGQGFRPYIRADKEVECSPHREYYTDADAQAVVDMINARTVQS